MNLLKNWKQSSSSSRRKRISRYFEMRVHMTKARYCLEQEKRNSFYRELMIYLLFLVLLIGTIVQLPVHFPFEQNEAVGNLFFDEEFLNISVKKTFDDIDQLDEMWQWIQGPLLNGFYDLELIHSRRIGSMQFRTGRLQGVTCSSRYPQDEITLFQDEQCLPFYFTTQQEDTQPYGNASSLLKTQYHWTNDFNYLLRSLTFSTSLFNLESNFGTGGYAVYLPRDNEQAARKIVQHLKHDFIQQPNVYLAISFSLYNPSSDLFSINEILLDLSPTDYIEKTIRLNSVRLVRSNTLWHIVEEQYLLMSLLVSAIYLIVREFNDYWRVGISRYFESFWNILDLCQVGLLISLIWTWFSFVGSCNRKWNELYDVVNRDCSGEAWEQVQGKGCYVELQPLAWDMIFVRNISGLLAWVSVAIVFKYLRLNSRLNLLWRTLRIASMDLLAFVVIFFTIFFGYAVMGFMLFGSSVRYYHSISSSLLACFQMLLGDFDYTAMYEGSPRMANLFFFSYMISIYLIFVNMFIAIISEYYSVAQKEKEDDEANKKKLMASNSFNDLDNEDYLLERGQVLDVEYDLLKQLTDFLHGMSLKVHLLPSPAFSASSPTKQIHLNRDMQVLLVDRDYLREERHRLRMKFITTARVVIICCRFLRPLRHFFEDFDASFIASNLLERRHQLHSHQHCMSSTTTSSNSSSTTTHAPSSTITTGISTITTGTPSTTTTPAPSTTTTGTPSTTTTHAPPKWASSKRVVLDFSPDKNFVTYIPLVSRSASPAKLLESLRPGDKLYFDEGSVIRRRIELEVLGGQQVFFRPHEDTTSINYQTSSSSTSCCSSGPKNNQKSFGLSYDHKDYGNGRHIRCCRVKCEGNYATLDGYEWCVLPGYRWFIYFLKQVLLKKLFGLFHFTWCCSPQRSKNKLLTDSDLEALIDSTQGGGIGNNKQPFSHPVALGGTGTQGGGTTTTSNSTTTTTSTTSSTSSTSNSTGISCRFDELIRNLRIFIARKAQWKGMEIANMEDHVLDEAIAFVERFPEALSPLDKRELEGYKYCPQPVDTTFIRLPPTVSVLSELLSQNAHEVWSVGRIAQGWKWGPERNNELLLHPDLVPYECLREEIKQFDRDTSIEALKVIQAVGYTLVPPVNSSSYDVTFGSPAEKEGQTYQPKPIPTDDVQIPPNLASLVELLSENTHEVWAKMRIDQGWVFGTERNDKLKQHDGLVPYMYLTATEKQMDRNTAVETIKLILHFGFTCEPKERKGRPRIMRKFQLFGRSEENNNNLSISDAVVLAKTTHHAKDVFTRVRENKHKFKQYLSAEDNSPRRRQPRKAISMDTLGSSSDSLNETKADYGSINRN